MEFTFDVNGFEVCAEYSERSINDIFVPLIEKWTQLYFESGRRIIVFLSAPPGTGKSTLVCFLEYLSSLIPDAVPIQCAGLDGFHYHQEYILTHDAVVEGKTVPMKSVKGCPETFDIEKLKAKLSELRKGSTKWPIYDRNLHDVVEDVIELNESIILIEGNWLLSTEGEWRELISYCDYSVFISAEPDDLMARLIGRKIRGGKSYDEAKEFYFTSDKRNIERLMANHHIADTELTMAPDGEFLGMISE